MTVTSISCLGLDELCSEEFVAHASTVNCLKIGRKSSRVLVTGGEDHKVNLWAIGKPNAILSLSGHSSGIDSVSFDSSEVLVAAGAASGTIKLWDLEEAKIVRTLTGHRSNCTSVDFHPFGEFFASGSLDTNLKIWDIRKKGCIHTYKGHTRGVNAIRFTPDGRWVVSGGEDNTVKLWDLTAGKLLHDFKCHEGQIQCIDFHPNEFLLATGSADRTVKFWDLETFELIGSAGPETTGVRSLTFSPDGRTLLCGLHESLKVFSWEPIRCHDMVDVGWSRLSDLNVHEGKLLGCSYNQSCVGVWVVDISRIEPYAPNNVNHLNGHSETKSSSGNMTVLNEITAKARLSVSQNPDQLIKETRSLGRLSVSQDSDPLKEGKSTGSAPSTPQRINLNSGPKTAPVGSTTVLNTTSQKRSSLKSHTTSSVPLINKSDIIPVIVPRTSTRSEPVVDSRKEVGVAGRTMPFPLQSKPPNIRKFPNNKDDVDKAPLPPVTESVASKGSELSSLADKNNFPASVSSTQGIPTSLKGLNHARLFYLVPDEARAPKVNRDVCSAEVQKGGRVRSLLNLEKRERSLNYEGPRQGISHGRISSVHVLPFSGHQNLVYRHEHKKNAGIIKLPFFCKNMQKFILFGSGHSSYFMERERVYLLPCLYINSLPLTLNECSLYMIESKVHRFRVNLMFDLIVLRRQMLLYFVYFSLRAHSISTEKATVSATDEDSIADVMELHDEFLSSMLARSAKLQMVFRCWERNDVKEVIGIMAKMDDHALTFYKVKWTATKQPWNPEAAIKRPPRDHLECDPPPKKGQNKKRESQQVQRSKRRRKRRPGGRRVNTMCRRASPTKTTCETPTRGGSRRRGRSATSEHIGSVNSDNR
uniref:Katanin p80 WD40 repeat-containing subunit B1 homolog n=1 Tax=Cajanus cajan TaxID=3821 RepID=A0A151RIH0_CAJCA|nr:Katanin p80 WD40 repeat-containing subunit B1 isogeny 1 [Cajanus cajan]